MSYQNNNQSAECRSAEARLSDYIENMLSAREVWELEKHLAACADCSRSVSQMQATVGLLHLAERHDTGDDFMAKLHARLDTVEPAPAGWSLREAAEGWLSAARAGIRAWRMPALTAGFAAAALVLMVHGNLTVSPANSPSAPAEKSVSTEDLSRQVAFTASNPFDDPVAAKAEVDGANGTENRADTAAGANF